MSSAPSAAAFAAFAAAAGAAGPDYASWLCRPPLPPGVAGPPPPPGLPGYLPLPHNLLAARLGGELILDTTLRSGTVYVSPV